MKTFARGDKVRWISGPDSLKTGIIQDGPFEVQSYPGPAYVVHFPDTARLIGESALAPTGGRWIPCHGLHRPDGSKWQKLEETA